MSENTIIKIFCGISVNDMAHNLHPLSEFERAEKIVSQNKPAICYSNSPDFVLAISLLCEKKQINYEFFLNGKSTGKDIEPIFEDFNKAIDLFDKLLK